jgi:ubiquinone/menaquinone biosynthesis C-methylase UbiE
VPNPSFSDAAFDVATAMLTIHHWSDIERGLLEARRVARDRIVFLTQADSVKTSGC